MARDPQAGNGDREESPLTRRNYLKATSLLLGTGAVTEPVTAESGAAANVAAPSVNHTWQSVELAGGYSDPVVVTGPLSYRGPQPASPRLRNVTASAFDIAVEEWRYLDGPHRYETIGCLMIDSGVYSLPDGPDFTVNRVQTDHRWVTVTFTSSFSTAPVVLSQVQTVNGGQPIITRHRNISGSGMEIRVQEEQAQGPHRTEDIGYLAIAPGTGTLDGHAFEAGLEVGIDDGWQTISFANTYDQPVFLADVQTFNGWNTCAVRYRNLTGSNVEVKLEEEQSADSETRHVGERVGYLVAERMTDAVGFGTGGYGEVGYGG